MNGSSNQMTVLAGDGVGYVKLATRANFARSVEFKQLVAALQRAGVRRLILDVSECLAMDSTFIGTLAHLASTCANPTNGLPPFRLELLEPSDHLCELLDNLCVMPCFTVLPDRAQVPADLPPFDFVATPADRQELGQTSFLAHKTLMEVHPDNVPRFGDVVKYLADELKKDSPDGQS